MRGTAATVAALTASFAAATASCRTATKQPAPARALQAPPNAEAWVRPPVLRIGILTGAARSSIGADSGVLVSEARAGAVASATARLPRATFRPAGGAGEPRVKLLETGQEYAVALVLAQDSADATLAADASAYRGVFEVRAESAEALTVVNVVSLEDYLRGVVPNELSPLLYPEIEALKAQSVAARTYALRNLGQFKARGYDLCATAACQVYRGRGSEHSLTDQAVQETAGVTLVHRGELINALYTSTCGGHTEDAANVFEGEPQPYLRGVLCAPERESWGSVRTRASREPLGPEDGLNRDVALLEALSVVGAAQPRWLAGIASEADVRTWTSRLQAALRRRGCASAVEPPLARRASFFQHVVSSVCWDDRARRLLAPSDSDYLLQVDDKDGFSSLGERLAAALLLQESALAAFADNTLRPNAAITRAQALQLLAGLARRIGPPTLRAASFRRASASQLVVADPQGDEEETLALDPALALFRTLDGRAAAASAVALAPGDRLQLVAQEGRVVYLEAEQPRMGPASDRGSRYFRWELRLSPADVARGVARYGSVGEVKDVQVRRLGVSGRVVEVAVRGTLGELPLRGLKIRWGLGLRENLFVVDRELREDGSVGQFVFTGKGWGHGVGLCQVGAHAMAQAGASFEQILKHYYTGVALERVAE